MSLQVGDDAGSSFLAVYLWVREGWCSVQEQCSISLAKAHRQALEHMSDLLCFLLSSLSSKCSHQLLDLCSSMLLPASQCLHYQGDEHHAHPLTVFSMLPHLITKPYCRHHSWQNDKTAECKATTM